MARALIVGCGCHGRVAGALLLERGWQVRGSSRDDRGLDAIAAAGLEPLRADPDRVGDVVSALADVTVVIWLLGALGAASPLNGPRLGSLLEKVVDTPVRGFVLERPGPGGGEDGGAALVADAQRRWRIPAETVSGDRDSAGWALEVARAAGRTIGL